MKRLTLEFAANSSSSRFMRCEQCMKVYAPVTNHSIQTGPYGTGREVTRPAMKGVTGVFSREMPEAYNWNQVAQP